MFDILYSFVKSRLLYSACLEPYRCFHTFSSARQGLWCHHFEALWVWGLFTLAACCQYLKVLWSICVRLDQLQSLLWGTCKQTNKFEMERSFYYRKTCLICMTGKIYYFSHLRETMFLSFWFVEMLVPIFSYLYTIVFAHV